MFRAPGSTGALDGFESATLKCELEAKERQQKGRAYRVAKNEARQTTR